MDVIILGRYWLVNLLYMFSLLSNFPLEENFDRAHQRNLEKI